MPRNYFSNAGRTPFSAPFKNTLIGCTVTEYNITYMMPDVQGGCVILTRIAISGFFVLTCYITSVADEYGRRIMPRIIENQFARYYIGHNSVNHCIQMHDRGNPLARHVHIGLGGTFTTPRSLTLLLKYVFAHANSKLCSARLCEKQFIQAIDFLIRAPYEPGVMFDCGHYALKDGYNPSELYPHGPFKNWKKWGKEKRCDIL